MDLNYAWDLLGSKADTVHESYFKIVKGLGEVRDLSDETVLIMDVGDGVGSFKYRGTEYHVDDVAVPEGTVRFINLDSVWYGLVQCSDGGRVWNELRIVDEMNDFADNPNPFGDGVNPFDFGFNGYLGNNGISIHSIVENKFYGNLIDGSDGDGEFGGVIPKCMYIVCMGNGFYGL